MNILDWCLVQCFEYVAEKLCAQLQHWLEDNDLDRILKNYDDNEDGELIITFIRSVSFSHIPTGMATIGDPKM